MSAMEQPALRSGRIVTWPGRLENVGAFRHEMHAAENDVFPAGLGGFLRQLVRVAAEIGKADDFIALVMVTEDDHIAAQSLPGRSNALVHGVVGQNEIIFQTANRTSL